MDFSAISAQLNAGAILPEGIVIITILLVLIGDLIAGRASDRWTPYVAIAGSLAAAVALAFQWDVTETVAFLGGFNGDRLSILFRGTIVLSAALSITMSVPYINQSRTSLAEFISILLAAALGGMFLSGANELVAIFVALETLGISSYVLTGYMKRDARSNEAALKYLLIGAASSAILLYSFSLLYGVSGGETGLSEIAAAIASSATNNSLTLTIALVFAIATISFKISAVPFHQTMR